MATSELRNVTAIKSVSVISKQAHPITLPNPISIQPTVTEAVREATSSVPSPVNTRTSWDTLLVATSGGGNASRTSAFNPSKPSVPFPLNRTDK